MQLCSSKASCLFSSFPAQKSTRDDVLVCNSPMNESYVCSESTSGQGLGNIVVGLKETMTSLA